MRCFAATLSEFGGDVEGVEGVACVAAGVGGDGCEGFSIGFDAGCAEPIFGVGEGSFEEADDLVLGEGYERVDATAGEERGVDLEGGIFGGGADEADGAALDVGEEGVLLGLVEAMDLVDEEDGARAEAGGFLGLDHDLLDLLDAGEDGGELDEGGAGGVGDDLGEGGFADTGWAPEDHGGGVVGLDGEAEGFAGAEEVLLAGVFGEGAGAHALGEWCAAVGERLRVGEGRDVEEAHGWASSGALASVWSGAPTPAR